MANSRIGTREKILNVWSWLTYHQETPKGPERRITQFLVEILSDEHNDAEVGVDPIRSKERREDDEPGRVGG